MLSAAWANSEGCWQDGFEDHVPCFALDSQELLAWPAFGDVLSAARVLVTHDAVQKLPQVLGVVRVEDGRQAVAAEDFDELLWLGGEFVQPLGSDKRRDKVLR